MKKTNQTLIATIEGQLRIADGRRRRKAAACPAQNAGARMAFQALIRRTTPTTR